MLGAIPQAQQSLYHHPPIGLSGPYKSAQLLWDKSLSLSLACGKVQSIVMCHWISSGPLESSNS